MKKTIAILLTVILCAGVLYGCGNSTVQKNSSSSALASEEIKTSDVSAPFDLEYVGVDYDDDFYYYRDTTTDVLFLVSERRSTYALGAGITTIPDPETGLPMTYTRYMEIYNNIKG